MDITQPIAYNGLTCSPLTPTAGGADSTGTRITSVDLGTVPIAIRVSKRGMADGATASDAYLSGRPITIMGEVYGTSKGDLWEGIEAWLAAFSPRSPTLTGTDKLTFSQPTDVLGTWSNGFIPMYMYATPYREPWYGEIKPAEGATGGHTKAVFAQLLATDPYKYHNVDRISASLTTAATALTYRGNAPAKQNVDLLVKLTGAGPTIVVTITPPVAGIGTTALTLDLSGVGTVYEGTFSFDTLQMLVNGSAVAAHSAASIVGSIVPGAEASYAVTAGSGANITAGYPKLVYPEAWF